MKTLSELKYSRDHEWVRLEGDTAVIGITDFAQSALGDIVFVDFPVLGENITAGQALGAVESVKAASDIYAPISGEVTAVNDELEVSPELLNEDPYVNWIATLHIAGQNEYDQLMSEDAYIAFCSEA